MRVMLTFITRVVSAPVACNAGLVFWMIVFHLSSPHTLMPFPYAGVSPSNP